MTIAALAATSCSSDEPQEDTAASSADKGDNKGGEETKADPTQQAIDAYKDVLDNPENYERDFSDRDDYYPTGTYSYALIEANNDEVPELLLKNDCKEFSPVTFIAIGKDGKPFASDIALVTGAGSTGSRANVVASGEGDGIFERAYSSGRPEVPTTHYDFDGKQLTMGERSEWSQVTGAPADQIELEWYATADASGLKKNQSGPNFGSGESSGKSENKEKKSKKNKGRKPKPDLPAGYVKKDDADNDAPASANKNLPEGTYSKAGGPIPSDALEATVVRRYKESYMHDRAVFQSPSGKIKCAIDASFAGCGIPSYRDTKPYGYSKTVGANWWVDFNNWELMSRDDVPPYAPDDGGSEIEDVPYGKTIYFGNHVCHSEYNGMTCWNAKTGKGAFMSISRTEFFD
ncbi:hypothetical protein ACN4CT_05585 [Corynebacterium macclintockiae]|uniref:hypothetical protein n=1 Tax=Corynebacterium macclintockiae TaxID=2913501 RepID=UPI003EBCEF5D